MSNKSLIQNVALSEVESEDNLNMGLSAADEEGDSGEGESGEGEGGLAAGLCPAGFVKVKGKCVSIQAL